MFLEAGDELPLRERFPVVRRLAERMRALQDSESRIRKELWGTAVVAWSNAANALRPRMRDSGLHLMSLAPSSLTPGGFKKAMSQAVNGSCVCIDGGLDGDRLSNEAVKALKQSATPYACWTTDAWCPADASLLEQALDGHRGDAILAALHDIQLEDNFASHPGSRLVLLWDDPARHPAPTPIRTP